jgi:acyl-CoA thioester hydrolase
VSFRWTARVYWEDTDGGGVVYYANYLRFLERARTEWLRAQGVSQQALARDPGILFTVANLEIEYRHPARLDDELIVTCEPERAGGASLAFAQRIYRCVEGASPLAEPPLIAAAQVRVACVDVQTLRPQRLPEFVVKALATA